MFRRSRIPFSLNENPRYSLLLLFLTSVGEYNPRLRAFVHSMGGWKLEVFKMAVYMAFPVSLFYYFNQPSFFEGWMMEKRKELFPLEDSRRESIAEAIQQAQTRREERWEKLEESS